MLPAGASGQPCTGTASAIITGTLAIGSNTVTAVSSTAGLAIGMPITGTGIPANTTITFVGVGTFTMLNNATVGGVQNITIHSLPNNAAWLPAVVPPGPPMYPNNFPPTSATFPGPPVTSTCTICPATYTVPVCANNYVQIYMCQGNEYTFSLCTSPAASDFTLSVVTAGFAAIAAGYYGPAFDNDGCGTLNGPSELTFSPQINGVYRIRIMQDPCLVNGNTCGTLSITCSIPTPPANDDPCNAIALNVPIACSYELHDDIWATGTTGIPAPGCGAYFNRDIWFTAVVPPSGNLRIQSALVSATSLGMAAYTTPACNAPLASWSLIQCSGALPPLLDLSGLIAPGTTVYIRVWPQNNISNMGTFNICAFEPTPPNNDLPCGATNLPTPATCSPNAFTTEFAGNTTPPGVTVNPPTCGGAINNDVWFEVTVPPSGAFTVNTFTGTLTNMAMAWYRLSAGGSVCNPFSGTMTLIACNDDQFAPTNMMPRINSQTTIPPIAPALVPGETIYIRVWPQGATVNGTFSICATENLPPPNDEPCGAIPLTTSLSCNLVPSSNEGASLSAGMPAPPCGGPVQNDVWYSVTVPPNGQVEFNTQPVGLTDAAFALYTTSGGCAAANLSLVPPANCYVGGSGFGAAMPFGLFAGLAPGSTVYLRVWRQAGNVGLFNICARQTAAAPVVACDQVFYDSGGPSGNYGNNEVYEQTFCPANPGDKVSISFSFFATQQGTDILTVYDGPSIASPVIGVFSGGTIPTGVTSTHAGGCLTIRFVSNGTGVAQGWVMHTSCGPPLPPPAPPCHITTAAGTVLQLPAGTSNFYDSGGPAGNYANNEFSTYTFCPSTPGDVITITFSSFNVEANFDFLTVFNGPTVASPTLGTFTGTNNPGTLVSTDPSGCLTVRWTSDFIIVAAGWAAIIRCGPPQAPPPPLPPPTGICGTQFFDPGGPNGNYPNNVNQGSLTWWQTFCPEVPGDVVTLSFLTFALEFGFDDMYVYNGTVVSPNNANGTQIFGNNPGLPFCDALGCNTLLGPGGWTGTALPGPFTATITPQNPNGCLTISMTSENIINFAGWSGLVSCQSAQNPNPDCVYALRMYDSFGDGWAGSTVTVIINGGTPSVYTIQSGNFSEELIGVDNGDVISITYSGLGYFSGDNSWTFDQVGAPFAQYHSAIPAVSGNYNFVVNCNTQPLAPQTDCLGAQILCNNLSVTAQTTNIGSVGDFTATSGGCLSIYEEQGEWFTFEAGSAASLGFNIVPTGTADVNFAVWGPFPTTSTLASICGPVGAPIRCSFASGANTFAATGSYTTGMGSPTFSPPQYAPPGTPSSQTIAGNGWVSGITPTAGDIYLLYVSNATGNGTTATINWTGPGTISCILPVELLHFDATAAEAHVDAFWRTGSEQNSAYFNVQRSADGIEFTTIGRVNAAGHSYAEIDYHFKDIAPLPGLSYYRLEQVDLDGTAELSNMVPVFFKGLNRLKVFPNPTRDLLNLAVELEHSGTCEWRVMDGAGRTALRGTVPLGSGAQRSELSLQGLAQGAYQLIVVQGDTEVGRAHFVKQ